MSFSIEGERTGWRHVARTLRTPKLTRWYGDADPRSWRVAATVARRQHLGVAGVRRAATIVRSGRSSGRYLATLPRSGTNWLIAMLCCGLSIAEGNEGRFHLEPERTLAGDDEWVFDGPRHWWPALPATLGRALMLDRQVEIGSPLFLVCHDPIEQGLIDATRARSVVTVRDPRAAAISLAHMIGPEALLASPQLDTTFLRIERFFRRWDARLQDPEVAARTLVLRYEDLRADPTEHLDRIDQHWELGLDRATWALAAEHCSWSAMAEMAEDRPDNVRITMRRSELPDAIMSRIDTVCDGLGASYGYPIRP